MRDSQRAAVLRAEESVWWHPRNAEMPDPDDALAGLCESAGAWPLEVEPSETLSLTRHVALIPDWAERPLTITHAAAHACTPECYPAHGVEFVTSWLRALRSIEPELAEALRIALLHEKVRFDPADQSRDVRRRLVDTVNNKPGELILLTLSDPVEERYGHVTGAPGLSDGLVYVDNQPIPLSRVRYISTPRRF